MRPFFSMLKMRFINSMQYRAAAWAGVMTQFFWGFMELLLYLTLSRENPTAFTMTLPQLTSYLWLRQAFFAMFLLWSVDQDILDMIMNGDVAYEVIRPVSLYSLWFARNLGSRASKVALRCVPILVVSLILPKPYWLSLPPDLFSGIGFVVSIIALWRMDVEKHLDEDKKQILERQKAAVIAEGGKWIDPEERERLEQEKADREAEEERIKELKARCKKEGKNFEEENRKYLEAQEKRKNSFIGKLLGEYYTVRNRITWQREKGRGSKSNWKNSMEDIWFATKSDDYTFNIDDVKIRRRVIAPYRDEGEPKDWQETGNGKFRDTHPSNFWDDITVPFWSMAENTAHPAQKPEKLMAKLILASSNEGDLVFDPFAGSGTACVTAKKLGRRFIGIEKNERYCVWAQQRLEMAEDDKTIQGYEQGVFRERNYRR